MDLGHLNLFIKMLREEYKLENDQLETLKSRLLADDREFEKVWKQYKNKSLKVRGGVDTFRSTLNDLIN